MTQQSHLRPVTTGNDGGDSTPGAGRGPQRQRAAKPLPTDRMKMDRQITVLRTIGRLSGPRKEPVDGNALSKAVGGVAATTVILSNRFFANANWIVNSGKGLYAGTDALVEYTRRLATGAPDPAEVLRAPAQQAWFWEALHPHLSNGPLAVNEAAILLMRAANATESHMPMILNLIAWMEHVGLISVRDNFIAAKGDHNSDDAPSTGHVQQPQRPADPQSPAETGREGAKSTLQETPLPAEPLVAFGLDVRMTVADLERLSPEQIKAFFEAVGTVAALKHRS